MRFVVAFLSREESREALALAVKWAAALYAGVTILKVIADPFSVGVIAELIATDEAFDLAVDEVDSVVAELIENELNATGEVRKVDEVGKGIVESVIELNADTVFVGTRDVSLSGFVLDNDPIAHYIVDHCPVTVVLVRQGAER